MKLVIQRVTSASVAVNQQIIGQIRQGYLVLLGVGKDDTEQTAEKSAQKLIKLRIFADADGKTNLSIKDIDGEILVISQFTLYADCKSNRPGFTNAGNPELARHLYEYFINLLKQEVKSVQHGEFGADMQVQLCNDGPFTILLEY
ncbi:MAG: D-tyrosyl-tRNA(Tyr) deacylase [Oscillospiraceae bacterium]|nr:D-tyrosyl-tRNA(Tyr) deacylase [Oscillospiraceae bacterium]